MKALSLVALLISANVTAACWDNEKEKRAHQFMSTLSKCDDCKIEKPFLVHPQKDPQKSKKKDY